MLRNYLLAAIRQLQKNKSYAILNTFGLSVGLACFCLIALWVRDELSFDRMHSKADRIFRVAGAFHSESDNMQQAVTPIPLAAALRDEFPEVEETVRLDKNDAIVQRGEKRFMEDDLLLADPSFFHLFDFKLLKGNPRTALIEPYSIVLSERMAKKYFGEEDPINQTLTISLYDPGGNGISYLVTGVIEDCSLNSHFQYTSLISFKTLEVNNPPSPNGYDWYNNGYYTYVLVRDAEKVNAVQAKLPQLIEKYMGKNNRAFKVSYEYFLQPLTDIHLHSQLRYEIEAPSSITNVVVFGSIGIIVLLLACINYVNLATASASSRFKEVGMRKVIGAAKVHLITQYLLQSILIALLSFAFSIVWMELSKPLFESLTGKPVLGLYSIETMASLLAVTVLVGGLSGLYPAILMTALRPIQILRGQWKTGKSGVLVRKTLVIFQYTVTIVLVVGIFVVQRQLKFIQSQDLGFNQDNLLMLAVNGSQEVVNGFDHFANELKAQPNVDGVARSNSQLAGGLGNAVATMPDHKGLQSNATVFRLRVDHDYLNVYQMKLLAGRFFQQGSGSDSSHSFVVNHALVRSFGYDKPEDIIGQPFQFQGINGQIIGVVKDFNYSSLQNRVEPACIRLLQGTFSQIAVRLKGDPNISRAEVEHAWRKNFPNSVVDFRFAEESLENQYQAEKRFSQIFLVFSGLSLAIACLGLFALISHSVESRTKEIGIRKVLGATASNIVGMLSKEFLGLIAISSLLATPFAYYFMNEWLSGFAYHIEMNITIIFLASTFVLLVAWITISSRSVRAAGDNPINSLRSE